jgi:hypothetical protein
MLFDPVEDAKKKAELVKTVVTPEGTLEEHKRREFKGNFKLFERWVRFKQFVLLKSWKKQKEEGKKSSFLSFLFFW